MTDVTWTDARADLSSVPDGVREVWRLLTLAGGRPLLVGGSVVDLLQGRVPLDWDLEVYGISMSKAATALSALSPDMVGKAFGIIKVTADGVQVDVNVPRRENSVGVGHRDFEVALDPQMTIREAASRRDFTINAMGLDIVDGRVCDPFGGLADLERGLLRIVSHDAFVEDPLRVLRGMQLGARKLASPPWRTHVSVDGASLSTMSGLQWCFDTIPKERVWAEFQKLMLHARRPSVGILFLQQTGWLKHFPELVDTIGCEQHPEWHPEGDVWIHSLKAVDAAASIRAYIPKQHRMAFMLAALLHDVGKPSTTITAKMIRHRDPIAVAAAEKAKRPLDEMLLTAHGHDVAGVPVAESFLQRMTYDVRVIRLVKGLVGAHMRPYYLFSGNASQAAWARLHRDMLAIGGDLMLLGRLCQCDSCATGHGKHFKRGGIPSWEHPISERTFQYGEMFAAEPEAAVPLLRGADLVAAGVKPGPALGEMLRRAVDLQEADASLTREDLLAAVLS